MTETDLQHEVSQIVIDRINSGEPTNAAWLTQAVVGAHPDIHGSDAEWYTYCAYGSVRDAVRDVLRKYRPDPKQEPDRQILLPGFERLQQAYLISRGGDQVLVAINQLTDEELEEKAREYEVMAQGCLKHADELRRYRRERRAAA